MTGFDFDSCKLDDVNYICSAYYMALTDPQNQVWEKSRPLNSNRAKLSNPINFKSHLCLRCSLPSNASFCTIFCNISTQCWAIDRKVLVICRKPPCTAWHLQVLLSISRSNAEWILYNDIIMVSLICAFGKINKKLLLTKVENVCFYQGPKRIQCLTLL